MTALKNLKKYKWPWKIKFDFLRSKINNFLKKGGKTSKNEFKIWKFKWPCPFKDHLNFQILNYF